VDKRPADRPAGHEPPPEPAHPPRRSPARREERARSRSRNRGRRGGTRHKQGYRALQDPHSVFGRPSGAERRKKKKGPRGGRSHQLVTLRRHGGRATMLFLEKRPKAPTLRGVAPRARTTRLRPRQARPGWSASWNLGISGLHAQCGLVAYWMSR
jgi:hypothetical protein